MTELNALYQTITEVSSCQIAQQRINEGWHLINAGFRTNKEYSETVYILGNTKKIVPGKVNVEILQNQKD
ncbi:hypothetical protein Cpap_1457 [Ruminiclostridium papyrosolvens DSM 2782]|uniref:Uncharacterized protein n=1 Tax=Ruminiclostridium papyrosolvens DSM 2782 TaxID=588581 RepID=F1TE99_9FIRM|nr:hypothetical protein [Ruminiclostridium papyrosolvens]EGD47065.1 hypothetical protein Cpap_1457 [Ruminiclostridium papyrosolvens DSM 2782]WES36006.1 hypothetical protein P0092_08610 [Ruminiclostridium papyrosolvens DSM 2782]WES36104.1 hypothetical protein P0092_09110 [Ruminiclostridium papyrosolvens DSM 2782]